MDVPVTKKGQDRIYRDPLDISLGYLFRDRRAPHQEKSSLSIKQRPSSRDSILRWSKAHCSFVFCICISQIANQATMLPVILVVVAKIRA